MACSTAALESKPNFSECLTPPVHRELPCILPQRYCRDLFSSQAIPSKREVDTPIDRLQLMLGINRHKRRVRPLQLCVLPKMALACRDDWVEIW